MAKTSKALELLIAEQPDQINREPWEMQINEDPLRFEAFRVWRDCGPGARRTRVVADHVDRTTTTINIWAKENDWAARTAAWDRHCDTVARQAELDAIQDMKKRHVQISMQMQALGVAELSKLLRTAKKNSKKNCLTAADAARLVEQGMRLERLNMGEAESVNEDRGGLSWTDLVRKAQDK